jgi:integrase
VDFVPGQGGRVGERLPGVFFVEARELGTTCAGVIPFATRLRVPDLQVSERLESHRSRTWPSKSLTGPAVAVQRPRAARLPYRHQGGRRPVDQVPRLAAHLRDAVVAAGVPVKVVSERLGHTKVSKTLDVYAHVLPEMQAAAAATLGSLLYG